MELLNRTLCFLIAPCRSPATASEAPTQGEGAASQPHSPLLGIFGAATLLIGVLVLTGNMMLSPSDGQGLLQFVSGDPAAQTIRASWEQHGLLPWAQVMLLLDSMWVLAYVPFLALLIARSAREIRADFPAERRLPLLCWVYAIGIVAVLALALADLVENWAAIGMLAGRPQAITLIPASLMAPASQAKMALAGTSVLVAALLLLTWFFNLLNFEARRNLSVNPRASQRALLRLGVADIVWRSRYVLFTLIFFASIVLAMDQGRDVLVGMAQGIDKPERWPWVAGGIVISVVGVWVLAYACWLWSRVMARMLRPDDEALDLGVDTPVNRSPDGRDAFAKWWARLLGMAPFLMLAWLCGLASRDAVRAGVASTAVLLLWFGAASVLLAALVLGARVYDKGRIRPSGSTRAPRLADKHRGRYFDAVDETQAPCELSGRRYRFLWAIPDAPLILPILSLVLFEVIRGLDLLLNGRIPLTLAVIALALSLWTSVLGLIAQVALRQSVPWVLFLVLAIGVLGGLGWTDNHRVWTAASGAAGPSSLWLMWGFQSLLAVVVLAALTWVYFRVAASTEDEGTGCQAKFLWPRTWYGGPQAVSTVLLLTAALVLVGSDRLIFPADSDGAGQARKQDPLSDRKTLDNAIAAWVQTLKAHWDQANASGEAPAEVPVYFVSAEGGGIRSAYWTALVLDRLSTIDPHFPRRTFSISGVSGGSVGAAVWHGCRADPELSPPNAGSCIAELGKANLLTPLASGWLFEDALARVIPSSWCRLPGCGIMSRGGWFERSLEQDVAQLAEPMNLPSSIGPGLPYLFLNSTWIENGERAVASRVRIDPVNFAAAGDQLSQIGQDLLLSTAAHNSARFTYVNAIGSVKGKGHLADGGYFDNSGGHTTDDILRAFRRCLFESSDPCGMNRTGEALREWAQIHLVPQAIQIRNGIGAPDPNEVFANTAQCPADFSKPLEGLSWYSDLLGPALAAFNAIGTGSNGRVSEANICKSVVAWRRLRGATQSDLPPMRRIDLTKGDVLYPLGWYLSPTARERMERAASEIEPPFAPSPEPHGSGPSETVGIPQ